MSISSADCIDLLPYHHALIEHLRGDDPTVWQWFQKQSTQGAWIEAQRFELLKSTYRIDQESQSELYQTAAEVAATLGIIAPLTIYQSQHAIGLNASLVYLPGELHIVLHGPILEQLNQAELRALLGHELTHFSIWEHWDGNVRIADRMLAALTQDRSGHSAHQNSLRLLTLYNEILCDRGAYQAAGDLDSVVSMLLKIHTGVKRVNSAAFLQQAAEIFSREQIASHEVTHPELFIRARAIELWSQQETKANQLLVEMIEGRPGLEELDLLQQLQVARDTRRVLDQLFSYRWFCTDSTLAHARLFFPEFTPPKQSGNGSSRDSSQPGSTIQAASPIRVHPASVGDYFAFVLLDFLAADRELDEPAIALSLLVAEDIGVDVRFKELLRQELKIRKTQLDRIEKTRDKLLSDADSQET